MKTFTCSKCKQEKPINTSGGTGYAHDSGGNILCYECCAVLDRAYMQAHDKTLLYLTYELADEWGMRRICPTGVFSCTGHVSNWTGVLRFPIHTIRIGSHNIARWRYDVYFSDEDGTEWHGTQYGDNTQACHCRRLKHRR